MKLTYSLALLTHWAKNEEAAYIRGCDDLVRLVAERAEDDELHLSIGENQGDSLLRATLWRRKQSMVPSNWTYRLLRESNRPHAYHAAFDSVHDSAPNVLRACREMILAPLTE